MRPAGMKRPLALFTAFLKVFTACSTVPVSPASERYSLLLLLARLINHQDVVFDE